MIHLLRVGVGIQDQVNPSRISHVHAVDFSATQGLDLKLLIGGESRQLHLDSDELKEKCLDEFSTNL